MTQEQQDIDLGYELFNRAFPKGYFHITGDGAEALGRAARELIAERSVATREDVPSVEEIMHAFAVSWDKYAYHQRPSVAEVYARVAHDMMLKLAPKLSGPFDYLWREIEAERREQGLQWGGPSHDDKHSPRDWASFVARQMFASYDGPTRVNFIKAAALCCAAIERCDRSNNTLAGNASDPDAAAVNLYWDLVTCDGSNRGWSDKKHLWKATNEKTRIFLRAVAAKMGGK